MEEKLEIVSLHNLKNLSKKNDQIFKKPKKVIHMQKYGKLGKNQVINRVIHFIHIKFQEFLRFT